ncbi:MAG: amino acid ABC transporter permease [Bosea sp.]|jgi:general L-amino acid transport system permease protein|nr:amino acid ABC transporter permease [Bosea sp. (in: a-proteobacteria)]
MRSGKARRGTAAEKAKPKPPEGRGRTLSIQDAPETGKASLLYDPKIRGYVYQVLLIGVVGFIFYEAISNVIENLERQKIARGLGFWNNTAGFDINQALFPYTSTSSYGDAFWVGLLNTLLVAAIGIVLATILGFIVGIARLSRNWIIAKAAMVYVEVIRNLPLLLQLLFWYNAVLKPLPGPRQSITMPAGVMLNNRGLFVPEPVFGAGAGLIGAAFLLAVFGSLAFYMWAKKVQAETGKIHPVGWVTFAALTLLPLLAYFVMGRPVSFNYPALAGFNVRGGITVYPEFVALLLGLVTYTAGFIAEVVRAGILAVSRGQWEAADSLGIPYGRTLSAVVIPQAMRVIIPPLTSNYLNLTKNSSLAVAIGYPDLVQVFAGTVLNQTGQAVEIIGITMAVYLTISLLTSMFMNYYNSRMALVER